MTQRPRRGLPVVATAFFAGASLPMAVDLIQDHHAILVILALLSPLMAAAAVHLVRENLNRG